MQQFKAQLSMPHARSLLHIEVALLRPHIICHASEEELDVVFD